MVVDGRGVETVDIPVWGQLVRVAGVVVLSAVSLKHTSWNSVHLLVIEVPFGVLASLLVAGRRRWPLMASLGASALAAVSALATGPAALALASLATRRSRSQVVAAASASFAAAGVLAWVAPSPTDSWWNQAAGSVALSVAMVGWGLYVGSRRELLATLRRRAERAEGDQERRAGEARAAERTRIAREMHDVVAHHISQVSMRAGALAFRDDLTSAQISAEAELIRETANEALRELRSVLRVLRDPATQAAVDAPQPTFADLPALVGKASAAGQRIDFVNGIDGSPSPEIGRTVYRIVQEGLTNAARYAPHAVVHVGLNQTGGGVDVIVSNRRGFVSTDTSHPGFGLIGVAERVEVVGGRFERVVSPETFTIHAWLPCRP